MWGQDKHGILHRLNGNQSVAITTELNFIQFSLQISNIICAYVIGDFNGWQKTEDHRLNWTIDNNDGNILLSKGIYLPSPLKQGLSKYSFIMIDLDGNDILLSSNENKFEPFYFDWQPPVETLKILASQNQITSKHELELIAVIDSTKMPKKIIDVEWSYEPYHPLISLNNNKLSLKADDIPFDKITVSCKQPNGSLEAQRDFLITKEEKTGKLIHFIKNDDDYEGNSYCWDLWTFGDNKVAESSSLTKRGDFGVSGLCRNQNVIARKKIWDMCWQNDWSLQTPSFRLDKPSDNYYIVYGDSEIYTSLRDVVIRTSPRIESAIMDDQDKITAFLSHTPLAGTSFSLYVNSHKITNAEIIVKDRKKELIVIKLPDLILPSDLVEIRADNNSYLPAKVQMRNYLDRFYYPENDLGIRFIDQSINLRLWAPTATKVEVAIYDSMETLVQQPDKVWPMENDNNRGIHFVTIPKEDNIGKYYRYRLYFNELDIKGCNYLKTTYAVDPYAIAVGVNGTIGALIDLNSPETMPETWYQDSSPSFIAHEDSVIYEMHIRDFTISPASGVPQALRGKYLGAATDETYYVDQESEQRIATGLAHLVELGITHVHLLPIFDFSSVDETNVEDPVNRNWGYDPQNYNVPEGSYSTNPYCPLSRIKETRTLIEALHRHGIRVVMDVVYNHMTETSNLDKIVPGYYFRSDNRGKFTNGSGCGNEIASERPMVGKFIIDSITHWIKNYHIDGVRFDLMELIDIETVRKTVAKTQSMSTGFLIYGEPWKGGDSPLTNGTYRGRQQNQGFSIFNDVFRDAIRGNNSPGNGFVNLDAHNPNQVWSIIEGLKGSINTLSAKPVESINYVDAHDNYTLWDQLEKSQNRQIASGYYRRNLSDNLFENILIRQYLLAVGIIFTAQGIPFIQAGCEILRTKNGDHNSYKSSDEINAIHWQDKIKFKPINEYIKGLIKLRKQHPAFKMTTKEQIDKHLRIWPAYDDDRSGVIISHFKDFANKDNWQEIIVVYNGSGIDNYEIKNLIPESPSGAWNIVVNHQEAGTSTLLSVHTNKLPPIRSYSILVMHS